MENLENNLLIAEFMGVKPTQISSSVWGLSNMPFWSVTGPTPEKVMQDAAKNFGFDTDWNKLILVGQKCMELALNIDAHEWVTGLEEAAVTYSLGNVNKEIVEFIKWFNNQKGAANV